MKYTVILPNGLKSLQHLIKERSTIKAFFEEIYMKNLKSGAVSGITFKSYRTRMSDPNANRDTDVSEIVWGTNDKLIIRYMIAPTYKKMSIALQPRSRRVVPTTSYIAELHFFNASKALGDRRTFANLSPGDQKNRIIKMGQMCPLQIWSNDPSFYYQGMWEDLARIGGAAYKFPGPEGLDVWHDRHRKAGGLRNPDVRITKHLAQIINDFDRNAGFVIDQLQIL